MPGFRSIRKTNTKNALRSLGAVLLLLSYLAGNTGSGIVHELFHRHTSVSHSPAQEKDPCHLAIYHYGKDPKHKFHFIVNERGDNCHVLSHTEQILVVNPPMQCIEGPLAKPQSLSDLQFVAVPILLPSRAPPIV